MTFVLEYDVIDELFQSVKPEVVAEIMFDLENYNSGLLKVAKEVLDDIRNSIWDNNDVVEYDRQLRILNA